MPHPHQHFTRSIIVFLVLSLVFVSTAFALTIPPVPALINVNPTGNEGDWYVGAIPLGFDPAKPVLVFVQGLGGNAVNWWGATMYNGINDMYAYAYSSGYRTAFVNFRDADGNKGSMWLNGSVLCSRIKDICAYFRVPKVNVICHSKGGVDTQSAIVHYGAYPYVDKVFTLSTPHWGSQLADLAYGSWTWWLGALLGQQDDGTYVMQTGYMSYFRSITDNRTENNGITYYTAGGTNWGPFFSALYFGGVYLSGYGSNDGCVTVNSAHNPRGIHVFTRDLNHDNIRIGNKVWAYVEPYIRTYSTTGTFTIVTDSALASSTNQTAPLRQTAVKEENEAASDCFLAGGPVESTASFEIPVDSSSQAALFDLLVADPAIEVKFVSPSGQEFAPNARSKDESFFAGATHLITEVKRPQPGIWKAYLSSKAKNAFVLIARFDSGIRPNLISNKKMMKSGEKMNLKLNFTELSSKKIGRIASVSARVSKVLGRGQLKQMMDISFLDKGGAQFEKDLYLTGEPGLYNVSLDIRGTLADQTPYARSMVYSFMVDTTNDNGAALLQKIAAK